MQNERNFSVYGSLFCMALPISQLVVAQLPPPLGRLEITSNENHSKIIIDGAETKYFTPVTLVVSPRDYLVVVGTCRSQTVHVQGGKTARVACPPLSP